jgi:glutamate-1-semialdehyde 2,1-aminomutase
MALQKKKLLAIIQARYSSSRFPGKVLKKIKNKSFLEILINRLKKSKKIDKIIVATSKNKLDNKIKNECKKINIQCYRGSEDDVLDRFYKAAKLYNFKNILRVTADCPIIDPAVVDKVIDKYNNSNADYATNTMPPTFPDGLDVEIFSFKVLKESWIKTKNKKELREHVTTYIRKNDEIKKINYKYKKDYSFLRLTLDDVIDYKVLVKILNQFSNIYKININDLVSLYKKKKHLFLANMKTKRNEGENMPTGQKFWIRAKNIIPGGTMLFSKNPDIFLPNKWPAYFSKTKGCKVWDLDNNHYDDLSFMGIGTNVLGYNYPPIEKKVSQIIKQGTMSTLNSIEEILLAEKLIEIHPWAEMARFTRSGGEANSVAIRIARAATGKDKIAICGYHGWHDWYLSSNIVNKKNLDNHLMNEAPIKGVPKSLKNMTFPFDYNNFKQLEKIVKENNIGAIKMEVVRNSQPKSNFLKKVRKLATDKKIILIFDECTSGFRQTYGGIHKTYDVEPDIAIFGKALGNGYAINAIIGKKEIMDSAKSTFISSTFWTERIGPTAALETIKNMEKIKSWKIISSIGKKIKKNWKIIAKENKLSINIQGIDSLANFSFNSSKHLYYKTLISQEMLKNKILASNTIYASIAHKPKILDRYFDNLNEVFKKIKKCENKNDKIENLLETDLCISGMREGKYKKK